MQITYGTHEKWLEGRMNGIGGSDCSAILGLNPYKSNIDLWEEKTGLKKPVDISEKSYVKYGHDAESLLVKLFALDYPQYEVNYNDNFRVNYNDEFQFLSCTRDCDLIEKSTGIKGALEIKTTELLNSMSKEKWDNQIPDNYYCQVLQYFITDPEIQFVWVKAQIKMDFGDGKIKIRTEHYYFTREQCQEDIKWLQDNEIQFWNNNILKNIRPNRVLPQI